MTMGQGQRLKIAGLAVVSVLSILLATASTVSHFYQDRVMPNTFVGGVGLGSKTTLQAQALILERAEALRRHSLELTLDNQRVSVSVEDLGVKFDERSTRSKIDQKQSQFAWFTLSYWHNFFKRKVIPLDHSFDHQGFQERVEAIFGISSQARDAAIIVSGEELIVQPATAGISVNTATVAQAVKELAILGNTRKVHLQRTEQKPNISTEEATRIKTEIETSLQPLYLTTDDRLFTITKGDQYRFLTYANDHGRLRWHFSQTAISDYLTTTIARRLNVKMLPKTIMSDTGQVTQEGRNGRQVDVSALTQTVYNALVARTDTKSAPIVIPIQTVAFTERVVHPDYITGLFEGRYIHINLAKQKLFLIDGTTKVGEHRVSTGKWNTPTPKGTLYIINKFESEAYSRAYNLWMPFWMGLSTTQDTSGYRGYGIHELPCFNRECTLREGQNHLGIPVSHGCIRLGIGPAAEVFAWADIGTPVYIN